MWAQHMKISGSPAVHADTVPSEPPGKPPVTSTVLCLVPHALSPPGSSVHGILQARILEWLLCPPAGDLPDPGIKARSPALQVDCLPSEPPGKSNHSSTIH